MIKETHLFAKKKLMTYYRNRNDTTIINKYNKTVGEMFRYFCFFSVC